ncbi:hypothetical protein H632_c4365p0, partial [Helicosporidium sp. ATCC 50920]
LQHAREGGGWGGGGKRGGVRGHHGSRRGSGGASVRAFHAHVALPLGPGCRRSRQGPPSGRSGGGGRRRAAQAASDGGRSRTPALAGGGDVGRPAVGAPRGAVGADLRAGAGAPRRVDARGAAPGPDAGGGRAGKGRRHGELGPAPVRRGALLVGRLRGRRLARRRRRLPRGGAPVAGRPGHRRGLAPARLQRGPRLVGRVRLRARGAPLFPRPSGSLQGARDPALGAGRARGTGFSGQAPLRRSPPPAHRAGVRPGPRL